MLGDEMTDMWLAWGWHAPALPASLPSGILRCAVLRVAKRLREASYVQNL